MAKITVGTTLHVKGTTANPMDNRYVVERIFRSKTTQRVRVEGRTVRQRCFDRALTGYTAWDSAYVFECINAGSMVIEA